jgi:hypothetical protein
MTESRVRTEFSASGSSLRPVFLFISHTAKTRRLAQKIVDALLAEGIHSFARSDAESGEMWVEAITARLRQARALLILVSEDWPRDPYRLAELSMALTGRMQGKTNHIIPIIVDRGVSAPPILAPYQPMNASLAHNIPNEVASLVASRLKALRYMSDTDAATEIVQLRNAGNLLGEISIGSRRGYAIKARRTTILGLVVGTTGTTASIAAVLGSSSIGGRNVSALGGVAAGLIVATSMFLALLRVRLYFAQQRAASLGTIRQDDHAK